jgi:transcriptional regulator with XRE-family HTH domain
MIGRNIHFWRKRKRMSQGELAKHLKCSRQCLSHYECGTSHPGFAFIENAVKYFKIPKNDCYEFLFKKYHIES